MLACGKLYFFIIARNMLPIGPLTSCLGINGSIQVDNFCPFCDSNGSYKVTLY